MLRFATVLTAALALPGMTLAQDVDPDLGPSAGEWEATLSGNGISNNDFDNHNFGISGSVGKYIRDNVLLGVRQSVNFADVEGGDDVVNASTRGFADYVFNFGRFRPYIGVSLGGIYGEEVTETFAAGPEAGFKYYPDINTFMFAQTEYLFNFEDPEDADNAASDGQFFHTFGIGFNF